MSLQTGNALNFEDFQVTQDGIRYQINQASENNNPEHGDLATVHYSGYLLKDGSHVGQKFDSSLDRGEPFQFNVGYKQVISGWDKMVADMKIGEKRTVILPPEEAYGDRAISIIPANSYLIFEIELLKAE